MAVTGAVVVCLGVVLLATRQDPPQQPLFRATVDLVQVDVVVTDKDGNAVRGLTAHDFTIADRGRPQAIAAFQEVSHTYSATAPLPLLSVRHDVADNRTAQSQRLVVVVVDDLHIFSGRTDRAKDLTKQIINNLGPEASMALLFTSGEHGTEVTEDRSILLAAADTLKGRQPVRRPHAANDTQAVHGLDPEMSPNAIRAAIATVGSGQEFFENMEQYKTLEDAARVIGGDDLRRKAFVLITEGINKDLTGVFTSTTSPCELADPQSPCYHEMALRQAAEAMRRSNVTVYALDPRGHVAPQDLLRENFPAPAGLLTSPAGSATDDDSPFRMLNPVRLAQDGLSIMSAATGGFAVTDSDDFQGGINRILADLDHYYLIGFRSPDPNGKGYRPLDVKVAGHSEWLLRFRAGYTPGGAPPPQANTDPLLSGELPKTDLPLRIFAEAFPALPPATPTAAPGRPPGSGASGTPVSARVAVALEITAPTSVLGEADGLLHDDISYKVLAVNQQTGKVASRLSRAAALSLKPVAAATGPPPAIVSYEIQTSLDLGPGSYQLRASASSGKLGTGGSVYLTLDVPDFSRRALALSGVVLGYSDGERVPVAPTPVDATATTPPPSVPFAPTLDRVFTTTDTLRLFCQVHRASPQDAIHVDIEVIGADARAVTSSAYELGPEASDAIDHTLPLTALTAGPYRLRVSAAHASTTVRQEVAIVIR